MGRHSGLIACYASLARNDANFVLIRKCRSSSKERMVSLRVAKASAGFRARGLSSRKEQDKIDGCT